MRHLIVFLVFAFNVLPATCQNLLVVKYNLNDCVLCNANLINLAGIQGVEKVILYKNAYEHYEDVVNLNETLRKMAFNIVFSDSAFEAYDKTEVSRVYVLNENRVVYHSNLKDAKISEVKSYFSDGSEKKKGDIVFSSAATAVYDQDVIYVLDPLAKKILIISKNRLDIVADTIDLKDNSIVRDCFVSQFGDTVQYDIVRTVKNENPLLPFSPVFYDFTANDGRLYLIMGNKYIIIDGDVYHVKNFSSIAIFDQNVFQKSIPLQMSSKICDSLTDECYALLATQLMLNDDTFYTLLRKKISSDRNAMFTKLGTNEKGKLAPKQILPFYMPKSHSDGPNYNLLELVEYREYFMLNLYPTLYNSKSNTEVMLPIYLSPNKLTKDEVFSGTYKLNSNIESFIVNNLSMRILFRSNDSLKVAFLDLKGARPRLNKEIVLDSSLNNSASFFSLSEKGYFFYSRELQKFQYNNFD